MEPKVLTLGHSPDPDDAFMFYALAAEKIDTRGWKFEHVLQDIQTLNERATREELDITAISIHAYAHVAGQYALLSCGASMGDNYGPMVVTRAPVKMERLWRLRIAVPGTMTTAFLALQLAIGEYSYTAVPFDKIIELVAGGIFEAGLLIHEGQLTYESRGLVKALDLGEWWHSKHGLPLPLGGNVVRRSLGDEAIAEIGGILRESIRYGLEHREEAVRHAMQWARDMGFDLADRFVGMYVNDYTLDYGEKGRQAVELLLSEAAEQGFIPAKPDIVFAG